MPPVALPIDPLLPQLKAILEQHTRCVLAAPPGAGKTTRVPPAMLDSGWLGAGRVIMLEPRRLAARAAARRMAAEAGDSVGGLVGYRVRQDSQVSARTRIEVVTEGVLTRRLQDDPGLDGVGCVILDEFHERSLQADLALALLLDVQGALRDDLRLVVMSATLDVAATAALLGGAPVVESAGRAFPVEVTYGPRPAHPRALPESMAATIAEAMAGEAGSLLAFLPGEREILATAGALKDRLPDDVDIRPLYGALPAEAQDAAISPARDGRRKVVLATDIAETSLTIDGVRLVVDSGLRRSPRFDPRTGLNRLETIRISQAGAEQRRGRAGRLEPGRCWRLWPEAEHRSLPPFETPEIQAADLAPLALDLARWGVRDADALTWPTPPPAGALAQARDLLGQLGALDGAADGHWGLTAHGTAMAALPLHPRLAHMVLRARERDPALGALACLTAAVLEERDISDRTGPANAGVGSDLRPRLALAAEGKVRPGVHAGTLHRVKEETKRLLRLCGLKAGQAPASREDAGTVLALAYPDRIARRRPGEAPRFLLANGRGAVLDGNDPLAGAPWLVVADSDAGTGAESRIYRAAPVTRETLETLFAEALEPRPMVAWDPREDQVTARMERRLGALVLDSVRLPDGGGATAVAAVCHGIRKLGLACLPWTRDLERLVARARFVEHVARIPVAEHVACIPSAEHHNPEAAGAWPSFAEAALLADLEDWLGPFLTGITKRSQFPRIDLAAALDARLGWTGRQALDRLAPSHLPVPSGSRLPLDYDSPDEPVLAARIQQVFGMTETPRVANGRVPVLMHLLSPAGRPLQVTRDLAGFWRTGYPEVRKDMRGRYPKHPWPEDPMSAMATDRAKPRKT